MAIDPQALGAVIDFSVFDHRELAALSECFDRYLVDPGERVIERSSTPDRFFVILSGRMAVVRTLPGGDDVSLAVLQSGDIFGHLALLDGQDRSASVRALDTADVLVMEKTHFDQLIQTDSRLATRFMHVLSRDLTRRLRQANLRLTDIATLPNSAFVAMCHLEGLLSGNKEEG